MSNELIAKPPENNVRRCDNSWKIYVWGPHSWQSRRFCKWLM